MVSKIIPAVITTVAVAAVTVGVCIYLERKKRRENRIPSNWRKIGIVKTLYIFPLKSGHYIEIDCAECTEVGFKLIKSSTNPMQLRDRSFAVYGTDAQMKNGRILPSLVKIDVSVHDENHIALDAPQMRTLYVKIPESNEENKTFIHVGIESIEAADCGDEAARWVSHHIAQQDSGYRLAYYNTCKRRTLIRHQGKLDFYKFLTDDATGLFTDLTSILIVNQASVNDYIKKKPSANVTAMNFRPNIIIDGPDMKPYEEDNWDWLKFGEDVIMRNVKDCTRCSFTAVDPETGKRVLEREPLTTLSKYRISEGSEKLPIMGNHMDVKKTGIIRSGDPVYVGFN